MKVATNEPRKSAPVERVCLLHVRRDLCGFDAEKGIAHAKKIWQIDRRGEWLSGTASGLEKDQACEQAVIRQVDLKK